MTIIENVLAIAKEIAEDPTHGYDQIHRNGPDYDCSSLVNEIWEEAGVHVRSYGASYTGNMRGAYTACGFKSYDNVFQQMLKPGDVLLNETHHTALYMGNGMLCEATSNEFGGISGGVAGDQTGREIRIGPYYTYSKGWDCVLRYVGTKDVETDDAPAATGTWVVKSGDTLWRIAEKVYGHGWFYTDLMKENNLTTDLIHPGDVLTFDKNRHLNGLS